jgi:hypothetical protein
MVTTLIQINGSGLILLVLAARHDLERVIV